jgi:1-acyl-sn-glycerol-3-phosphate acyltransferase
MSRIRVLRRIVLLGVHILLGVILTVLTPRRQPAGGLRTHPGITSWWHNRLADILGVHLTVSGYRPTPSVMLVSNHVSWLDIVVLGGLTPTVFLSKHEVRQWPLVGWLAARAGTLFIRRGDGQAATINQQIAERLRSDGLLTLYAEGTTTDGSDVRPFFSRLFAAAIETDTAVVPVSLRYHIDGAYDPVAPYTGDQSLADNLRGLIGRSRTQVHVHFADPIPIAGQSRREIAKLAHDAVRNGLLAPPPLTGIQPAAYSA